jgi:hypothetical protein
MSSVVLLRHATLTRWLPSILKAGLLCSKSQGRLPAVWFTSPGQSSWATLHVVKRHGGRVESVVILEVEVPRRWLRRSKRKLWYCPRDVSPERIRRVITFGELSRSPLEETAAQ